MMLLFVVSLAAMSTSAREINQKEIDIIKQNLHTLVGNYNPAKPLKGNDDPTVSNYFQSIRLLSMPIIENILHISKLSNTNI